MKIRQFEVFKCRPAGFQADHWFVVLSAQERCDRVQSLQINALACFTLRGQPSGTDVVLDSADGFQAPTVVGCEFAHVLDKGKLHSSLGLVSWERQQQIKSKIKQLLRL